MWGKNIMIEYKCPRHGSYFTDSPNPVCPIPKCYNTSKVEKEKKKIKPMVVFQETKVVERKPIEENDPYFAWSMENKLAFLKKRKVKLLGMVAQMEKDIDYLQRNILVKKE